MRRTGLLKVVKIQSIYRFFFSVMATDLQAKIKFKQLCDTLDDIAKEHEVKKKEQILQLFIDECRSVGDKLKAEYPESVCTILYHILCHCVG